MRQLMTSKFANFGKCVLKKGRDVFKFNFSYKKKETVLRFSISATEGLL